MVQKERKKIVVKEKKTPVFPCNWIYKDGSLNISQGKERKKNWREIGSENNEIIKSEKAQERRNSLEKKNINEEIFTIRAFLTSSITSIKSDKRDFTLHWAFFHLMAGKKSLRKKSKQQFST